VPSGRDDLVPHAALAQSLPRHEVRVVLAVRRQDDVSLLPRERVRHQVDGFRRVLREDRARGTSAKVLRERAARILHERLDGERTLVHAAPRAERRFFVILHDRIDHGAGLERHAGAIKIDRGVRF